MKYSQLLIILFFFVLKIFSQPNIEWIRIEKSSLLNEKYSLLTKNGELYVASTTADTANNLYIVKYNSNGLKLWGRFFLDTGHTIVSGIALDSMNNIYVCGLFCGRINQFLTLKYDSNGNLLWKRFFSSSVLNDIPSGIIVLPNGNIAVCGHSNSSCLLIKYDLNGNLLWANSFNSNNQKYEIRNLKCDLNNNLYLGGTIWFVPIVGKGFYLKYNNNGDLLWYKEINENSLIRISDFDLDDNNNIYGFGSILSNYKNKLYCCRITENGEGVWFKTYDAGQNISEYGLKIKSVRNTNFIVCYGVTSNSYDDNYLTLRIENDGSLDWKRNFDYSEGFFDLPTGIALDEQNNIYLTGRNSKDTASYLTTLKYSFSGNEYWHESYPGSTPNYIALDNQNRIYLTGYNNSSQLLLIKYNDVIGISIVSNEISQFFSLSQNYPNPFNPVSRIRFRIPKDSFTKLIIYNALGKEISILINQNLKAGEYIVGFDGSALTNGVYFYKLTAEEFSETKKMVIIK